MGLPAAAAALWIFGTLVLATASGDSDLQVGLFPPCSATVAPEGPCEREGDGCPLVVNLPPMTVNLPKELMDLERLVEELQMLKNNVDELRKICKNCGASQAEKECMQGQKQDADDGDFDINRQIWENNKGVVNEDRRKDGKSPKDKTEQVVAAGKNVRISERRKVDRKQIDWTLDKQNSSLGNATTHMRNRTTGKSQVWGDQMMDSKKQTEAADETEDGGNEESGRQELHDKTILEEKNYNKKINNEEDMMKNKENIKPSSPDSIDRHIWSDKHHKASHEDEAEKNFSNMDKSSKQATDRDRPVWRDKTRVDTNQMERIEERGGKTSDASEEGKNAPKSSMHHVWLDETMETSSAERIKMSGRSGGGDMGQDHRANGEADRSLKGNDEKLRDFENRELMEGTDLHSGVVNSSPSHGFIDLDWSVTLTSPPTFTASHVTTDVKRGQNNGRGSSNGQLKIDEELAVGGDGENFENGGVANVEDGQLERPVLEIQPSYDEGKVSIDERYRPTKIATAIPLDTEIVSQKERSNFEEINHNKQLKPVKLPSKIAIKLNTTRSTTSDSHLSRDVIQGERKITSRRPSQTSKDKDIDTEDSNLDQSSSHTIRGKDSKIVNSNHRETKISKTVPTKDDSGTTTSPSPGNGRFITGKTGRPKTASGQPSRNNQGKNSSITDSSLDKLNKILGKDSNTELSTSDTTKSNSDSHLTYFKQEDSEGNEPPSPGFDEIITTSTPKISDLPKDIKNGDKKADYNNAPQNNQNEKASNPMSSSNDKHLSKTKNLFTPFAITEASTSSTPTSSNSHLGRAVIQGEQKITSQMPLQTTPGKDIKTKDSNLDFDSSTHTISGKESIIANSNRKTKISKTVPTEDGSDITTSPTAGNRHFITDVKPGRPKTASGQPSGNNQGKNYSGTMDTNFDKELKQILDEDSKSELTKSTSDTLSSASSTSTSSKSQSERKITSRRPSQTTPEKDINTEDSNLDGESSTNTIRGKDSKIVNSNHRETNISKTVPTDDTPTSPTAGKGRFITDVKPGRPKTASGQPSQNNQGKKDSDTVDTSHDKELSKILSEDSKSELTKSTSDTTSSISSTPTSSNSQDERKITSRRPSQTTPETDTNTEDSNLDVTDVKPGRPKTASGQPSGNNQGKNDGGTMDTSLDKELKQILGEDSKSELTKSTSDTASSTSTSSNSQDERKITSRRPSQTTPEKDINTEDSNLDVVSSINTISGKDSKIVNSNHHETNVSKTVSTKDGSDTTTSPTAGNRHFITDVKPGRPKTASGQPSGNNQGKNYGGTMDTNFDKELKQILDEDSKSDLTKSTSDTTSSTSSTSTSSNSQDERKITSRRPSQTTPEKDINTEDSNLDTESSTKTIRRKDSKIVNSYHHKTNISKTVPTDDTTTSPTAGKGRFITDVKPGRPKTASGQPSQNNQGKKDSDTVDTSRDKELSKILGEDSKSELTKSTSDTTSSISSTPTSSNSQDERKITSKPPSQTTPEKDINTEDSNLDVESTINTVRGKDSKIVNSYHHKTNLSKTVSTKDGSNTSPTAGKGRFITDVKPGRPKTASGQPSGNNQNKNDSGTVDTSLDKELNKILGEDSKSELTKSTSDKTGSISSTPTSSNSQDERKITSKPPSQTTPEKDINTEDSNVDAESSTNTLRGKESKIVNSNHHETNILKTVSTKDGSDTPTSPTAGKGRFITDVKPGRPKTASGQPSQNNQGKKDSDTVDTSRDKELSKVLGEDSKSELTKSTSDTTGSISSTPTSSNSQDERKITSRRPSQTTPEKDINTEDSNLDVTDVKPGRPKTASGQPSQNNQGKKDSDTVDTSVDKEFKQILGEDSKSNLPKSTSDTTSSTSSTSTSSNSQDERKITSKPPSQTTPEKDINTEDSNLDAESSTNTLRGKESKIVNSNHRETNILKTVSTKDGSDTPTSPTAGKGRFITDVKPGRPKTASGQPSQNNQGKKDSDTVDTSRDKELSKVLGEDSKSNLTKSTSDTTSSTSSTSTSSNSQDERKITSKPPSQTTPEKDINTEDSNLDVESSINTISGKDSKIVNSNHRETNVSKTVPTDDTPTSPTAGKGRFITSKPPSQTTPEKDINTEDSNLDAKSSTKTTSGKDIKIVNSNHYEISKTVLSTASPTVGKAHFITNVKPGTTKTTFEQPSENNQGKEDSDTIDSSLDEQLTKILSEDSNSELTKTTSKYEDVEEGNESPSQGNYNKMDDKTEQSSSNHPFYQPSFDEITTTTTPKLSKSYFTKDIKHGDKKETYTPPQNNPNEKASNPMSSSINTQLSKAKIQLTTVATTETSSSPTPTSSNSHLGRDVKPQQQLPDYKDGIQSNQVDNAPLNHDVQLDKTKEKDEQYGSFSTPATSKFDHSIFNGQLSQSNNNEHSENQRSSLDAALVKATQNAVNDSSNSDMTTSIEKERKETNKDTSSAGSISKTLKKVPSSFDVSAKVNIVQPTANKLAEDTTISTPTAFKPHFNQNSNQGKQETKQKTNYGQPSTHYNEKDFSSIQDAQVDTPTSGPASVLIDDISSSTLRHDGSFKEDLTSTTFTPHQISPTTTTPLISGNNRKISSSKTVPNQRPKPSVGKKPEANLKLKNPKNDRKLDRAPSPETQVKNDQRRMDPKVKPGVAPRPAQAPSKSDQSTPLQVNVKDNPLPSPTPIQKASTPTLAPSMTGVLTDERKRPNVTSLHDSRQTTGSEIDKVSRLKQFIKKTMKNNTGNVILAQNRTSEVNGTKESSKKNPKLNLKTPQINQKPKPQVPKVKPVNPKLESSKKVNAEQAPKDKKIPKINKFADLKNNSKLSPGLKPQTKPVKPKVIPAAKVKQPLKEKEKMVETDVKPTSGPIKLTTLNWETARDPAADPLSQNTTTSESLSIDPNSGVISSSQTTEPVPSIPLTTEPNIATQVSTTLPTKSDLNLGKESPSSPPRDQRLSPTVRAAFRSTAPPAPDPGPKAPAVENTTPSARELRVKINRVAAFLNKTKQQQPHGGPLDEGPGDQTKVGEKRDGKPDTTAARDCSDQLLGGHIKSGLYLVTPDPSGSSAQVLCDMEESGGGWTVLQRRHDGSVSFNRSWAEYRDGFGSLDGGEFWLGNNLIHLLTRNRSMELRVELEDFEGVREYAQYELFKVASERMRYRLTVDGYSGTAGDALRFNTKYNHNNRAFTTPDRDNDRYPSGNCGAYYSSGWWFDACMAANLNGRYYKGRYKGVRDGIYWGTWPNIATEYYPTNERLSFKTVRMMIRPKGFEP